MGFDEWVTLEESEHPVAPDELRSELVGYLSRRRPGEAEYEALSLSELIALAAQHYSER